MNDFETVRQRIDALVLGDNDAHELEAGANAALDRIEAEVIRYERASNDLFLQNEQLKAEVERLRGLLQHMKSTEELIQENERLRAEVERLRAALVEIVEVLEGGPMGAETRYVTADTYASKALRMRGIARAALAKEEA